MKYRDSAMWPGVIRKAPCRLRKGCKERADEAVQVPAEPSMDS